MDKLSMAIVAMEAHVACTNERLRQAWDVIHAVLVEGQKPTTNTARDETVRSCTSCGNEHCSMQAGFCSKWVRAKRTASPVA